jgi:hypothetical protein
MSVDSSCRRCVVAKRIAARRVANFDLPHPVIRFERPKCHGEANKSAKF